MMFGLKRLSKEDRARRDMEYSVLCCQQRTLPHLVLEDGSFMPSEQVNALMKMNIKEFKERWEYIEKITYYKNMCKLSICIGMVCISISILIALIF